MSLLLRAASAVDHLSERIGSATAWLTLAMISIGAYNAIARYVERDLGLALSSNAYIETQWYLFSAVFLLGGAAALRDDGHVRVDVLYARLSRRSRAWIDVAGTLLLLLPFAFCVLWASGRWLGSTWLARDLGNVWPGTDGLSTIEAIGQLVSSLPALLAAWATGELGEISPDPGGLPRYPVKTLVAAAFVLLVLQAVASLVRHVAVLCGVADGRGEADTSRPRATGDRGDRP